MRWGAGHALTVMAVGASVLAVTACESRDCTLIGSASVVRVTMPAGVPTNLTSVQITLCQGDRCEETSFSAQPVENEYNNGYIEKCASLDADTYVVGLECFEGDWDPNAEHTLAVTGLSGGGQPVVRHDESFTFKKVYPNGEECDETPYLQHQAVVLDSDVVAGSR